MKSYHFEGTQTDEDGTAEIEGDVTAAGSTEFDLTMDDATVTFRVIGTTAYLRADAAYWRESAGAQGDALAERLADRWVKSPSASVGIGELLDELSPRTLAACLAVGNGTLRDGGSADVGGRKADVLIDEGDKPGTTPGRFFTAADGPPLPVRVLQTGKRRPGGTLDPKCSEEDDTSSASDLQFSRFDEPVSIEAPKDAIEIPGADDGTATPAPT